MCLWLDEQMEGNGYMAPVHGLMRLALDGHPIDVSRMDWASATTNHVDTDGTLAGCMSRQYRRWREIAPDRTDLWRMLRNSCHDPKVDSSYPYAATSATIPPPSEGQQAVEAQHRRCSAWGSSLGWQTLQASH